MKENAIIMVGKKKSHVCSLFAVFELFKDWSLVRARKVIPDGAYFAVLTVSERDEEIVPHLFVQGYRPHVSKKDVSDKRRYGEFVPQPRERGFKDDIVFEQCQIYQIKGEREVELVLTNNERKNPEAIKKFAQRICEEQGLVMSSELQKTSWLCNQEVDYFLQGREYDV